MKTLHLVLKYKWRNMKVSDKRKSNIEPLRARLKENLLLLCIKERRCEALCAGIRDHDLTEYHSKPAA